MVKKKRSSFKVLKSNRRPLTAAERKKVMKANAVWHHGLNGAPTPAVWKTQDSHGATVFVTNTHRAYNTAPSVEGAIDRYHKFIKSTA